MSNMDSYYPKNISLGVALSYFLPLKNKVYLLKYFQHGCVHKKILTKAACVRFANDPNVNANIRDCIIRAFEEGVVE